jgi:hypothetical protein
MTDCVFSEYCASNINYSFIPPSVKTTITPLNSALESKTLWVFLHRDYNCNDPTKSSNIQYL